MSRELLPHHVLHELAASAWLASNLTTRRTAMDYVRREQPIPDHLLPGRFISRQPPAAREHLQALTSTDAARVAPWVVQAWLDVHPARPQRQRASAISLCR